MKLKRLVSLSLALALAVPLGACVNLAEPTETASTEAGEQEQVSAETEGQEASEPTEEAADQTTDQAATPEPATISPDDVSVTWDESRVFTGTSLGNYETITTYAVAGYDDVPFLRTSDYLKTAINPMISTSFEDGMLKFQVNGTEGYVDPKTATIHFDNTLRFSSTGAIDGPIVNKLEIDVVTESTKHTSTQTEPKPVTINLADYHMPMVVYEDDVLLPFLALQNTFGGITAQNNLAYNGKDYYNMAAIIQNAMEASQEGEQEGETLELTGTPYADALFSGPFSEKTRASEAYATYGYNATCLLLDLCYGHKEEKNIDTFDEYFERIGAKKSLSSTDPNSVRIAEMLLFYYLFDSGHDASMPLLSVFKEETLNEANTDAVLDDVKQSEEGDSLFGEDGELAPDSQDLVDAFTGALVEKGFKIPELVPTMAWMTYMGSAKPADYGSQRLDYAGDTAVIYFESFLNDYKRDPSFYLKPISEEDEEKSNFAFFYNCFEDIKQHDEVKNVVINLSNNGGGSATGLVTILGFLADDGEVNFTDLDMLSGSYREEHYHVDTNLDGLADDQDGFGGQYNFYIMTSGQSYSCGNALPYFAQRDGLAKIIGTEPGGGDCCVWTFNDAYGFAGSFSGSLKLGAQEASGFVSDEKAVTVDYNMLPSILDVSNVPWFDAEGIADAVHEYESGKTEADYGTASGFDRLPSLLEEFFKDLQAQDPAA